MKVRGSSNKRSSLLSAESLLFLRVLELDIKQYEKAFKTPFSYAAKPALTACQGTTRKYSPAGKSRHPLNRRGSKRVKNDGPERSKETRVLKRPEKIHLDGPRKISVQL